MPTELTKVVHISQERISRSRGVLWGARRTYALLHKLDCVLHGDKPFYGMASIGYAIMLMHDCTLSCNRQNQLQLERGRLGRHHREDLHCSSEMVLYWTAVECAGVYFRRREE